MRTLLITSFITLLAATADAQVQGYAIAGPADVTGFVSTRNVTFSAAGGAEVFLGKYVSVGGGGGFFERLITVSADAAIHAAKEEGIVPFLSAGYTRIGIVDGEGGGFNAVNLGAGANGWIAKHAGIRFELRDYVRLDPRGTTNYWSLRAGFVFR